MAGVVAAKMKEKKLREEEEEAKVSNLSLNSNFKVRDGLLCLMRDMDGWRTSDFQAK